MPHKIPFLLKNQILVYYSLLALCLVFLFRKYLFFSHVYIFEDIGNDTLSLFYPRLLEFARTFREEGMPLWSFSRGIGQASYSKNFFNPFTWIYLIVGVKHLAYAISWVQFLKIALTVFFSHHLFRLHGLSIRAVLLGSTLVAFLGYLIVGSSWYGHSTNIMFIVMLLLALELLFVKNQWWLLPIPVTFLVGPSLLFAAEFAILYTIMRFTLMNRLSWTSVFRFFKKLALPLGFCFLFIAPFVGSTVYKFLYSPRVGGEMSLVESLSSKPVFDLSPAKQFVSVIYRFFSNDILGTAPNFIGWKNYLEAPLFYCGLLTLLLVPQLFVFLKRKQKIIFVLVLSFWMLILIFPYFRYAFYFFVGDYYKSAISLFVPLTLIIMATTSFHFILREKRINIVLLGSTLAVLLGLLFLTPTQSLGGQINVGLRNIVALILLAQSFLLLIFHYRKHSNLGFVILLFALMEGTFISNLSIDSRRSIDASRIESKSMHNDYTLEALDYLKRIDPEFYRIEKSFASVMSGLNDSQSQGFFGTRSYSSHNHSNYIKFLKALDLIEAEQETNTRWLMGFAHIPQLYSLFSIKYLISDQASKTEVSKIYYESLGELNGLELYKSKYFIPFGIPFNKYSSRSDLDSLDTFFKKLQLHYTSIILDDSSLSKYPQLERVDMNRIRGALAFENYQKTLSEKAMKIASFKQDRILGTMNLDEAAMVFYSIPFDAGWRAHVNGEKLPLVEVNNGLTGLYLEPGNYDIDLRYQPPYYRLGWILFGLGILASLFIFLRKKRLGLYSAQVALLPPSME